MPNQDELRAAPLGDDDLNWIETWTVQTCSSRTGAQICRDDVASLLDEVRRSRARPPLTRERVEKAVATLFIHPDGSRSHECGWTEGTIVDRLCRLLGVTEGE